MKYYPCGSLADLIHHQEMKPALQQVLYNDTLRVKLATDIACGLTAIHMEGLFHSDMKVIP
jgi:serine/threonine protein kinase